MNATEDSANNNFLLIFLVIVGVAFCSCNNYVYDY